MKKPKTSFTVHIPQSSYQELENLAYDHNITSKSKAVELCIRKATMHDAQLQADIEQRRREREVKENDRKTDSV